MSIGGSIFLLALGAIFAFAVRKDLSWLDVNVVGWVLMCAGLVMLALTLTIWSKRRNSGSVVRQRTYQEGRPSTVSEREVYHDASAPPPRDDSQVPLAGGESPPAGGEAPRAGAEGGDSLAKNGRWAGRRR